MQELTYKTWKKKVLHKGQEIFLGRMGDSKQKIFKVNLMNCVRPMHDY